MDFKFITEGKLTRLMALDNSFFTEFFDRTETKKWVKGLTMASNKEPYAIIYTANYNERELLTALKAYGKAVCVKTWTRGNFIDDPYGKMYKVGTIDCSLWDLRSAFGITEPLEKFLPFEVEEFLKGNRSSII